MKTPCPLEKRAFPFFQRHLKITKCLTKVESVSLNYLPQGGTRLEYQNGIFLDTFTISSLARKYMHNVN